MDAVHKLNFLPSFLVWWFPSGPVFVFAAYSFFYGVMAFVFQVALVGRDQEPMALGKQAAFYAYSAIFWGVVLTLLGLVML